MGAGEDASNGRGDGSPVAEVWRLDLQEAVAERAELDDRIGVLAAQIHALQAELVQVVAEFQAAGGLDGSELRSAAPWLSVRTKFTTGEAKRLAAVAAQQDRIPTLMGAARQGRVSLGLLEEAARVSTPENERRVAEVVLSCTPSQAKRVLSTYQDLRPTADPGSAKGTAEDGPDTPAAASEAPTDPAYWWRLWHDEQGRGRLDAAFDATTAALLEQAWEAAKAAGEQDATVDAGGGGTAEAGVEGEDEGVPDGDGSARRQDTNEIAERLASTMIDHAHDLGLRAPGGERFHVQLSIDVQTLARILGVHLDPTIPVGLGSQCFLPSTGRHLSDAEAARFLCDAGIQVLVHQDGVPLWMGNESRTANRQQRRALRFRSGGRGGCEFPGCTQTRFVDAHHVRFHAAGGETAPDNLVLLCGFHHRELHRSGWRVTSDGAQGFTFWDGPRCLGSTCGAEGRPAGRPPDLQRLPGLDRPPDPPECVDGDTARSATGGERMTPYALDVYLANLLAA